MDEELLAAMAQRGAIFAPDSEGLVRGWTDLFDHVQVIAEQQDLAGDFEEAACRSSHAGAWTWREFLADALTAPPGRPPTYAPLGRGGGHAFRRVELGA